MSQKSVLKNADDENKAQINAYHVDTNKTGLQMFTYPAFANNFLIHPLLLSR